jgi:hypothetical protein
MLKRLLFGGAGLLAAVALAAPVAAAEKATVTLEGRMICAKCTLGEERDSCQNVLAVAKDEGPDFYFLENNEANKKFGEVCTKPKTVKATGTVSEKDGQKWLAATSIVPVEKEAKTQKKG